MYPIDFLVINDVATTGNSGILPDHYLNKVTEYKRKQLDIYFCNPDFLEDNDEPQHNILSIEYTEFKGLFSYNDPIRTFKKSIEFLVLNVDKWNKNNYANDSMKYSIYWEDITNNNISDSFTNWMKLVTNKSVFSLKELDLLYDYQRSFYHAYKLLPEMLTGGLWGGGLSCFENVDNLLDFCNKKHKVKDLPPHNKYGI